MTQRRRFTAELKAQVVLDILSGTKSAFKGYRQHQLNPQVLFRWQTEFLERTSSVFGQALQQASTSVAGINLETLSERRVLILGLGREGMSTFAFLRSLFPQKFLGLADKKSWTQL